MIVLEPHPAGTIFSVRARAGAKRNAVTGIRAGSLLVWVTQAPEKGKANKAIVALLAESLGLRKSQLELLAGETSPQKRFLARRVAPAELRTRIEQLGAPREDGG
jgi:uncharacterized protein YggU (UPF0235/DUF167 family)